MKNGFRPRLVRQIFSSVPAARSRCLSSFIAIARQGLPTALRYEPSTILGVVGASLVLIGMILMPFTTAWRSFITPGWIVVALAFIALVCQHRLDYGSGRSRLIRSLDEARRVCGLDEAILPESLEFLEASAQQWERIEHALQTQPWELQDVLRSDIARASHRAMEEIVLLECGSTQETGLSDTEADQRLISNATSLRLLADAVDAAGTALATYPRTQFASNGAAPTGVLSEMVDLELAIQKVTDALSRSVAPV